MKKIIYFPLFFLCLAASMKIHANAPFMMDEPQNLIVNNRILAKVNDKTISVIDVMKKMDVYLNRAYPHLANSKIARYQFYSSHWQETLNQMVDDQLMILDSEGKDLKISDGDVRESIQTRFGPNVMGNLDRLGLTYEEARQMIQSELIVQRMLWFRIQSKALISVNPQDVKASYKEYCAENPPCEQWQYQVLSIRSKDKEKGKQLANQAYQLLNNTSSDLATIAAQLKEKPLPTDNNAIAMNISHSQEPEDNFSISLSEDYHVDEKSVSQTHKEVLFSLKSGSFSPPVAQISRIDNTTVYRIFHLKDHQKKNPLPFEQLKDKLEDQLIQKAMAKESESYILKLREKFGFTEKRMFESLPVDFQPFVLN